MNIINKIIIFMLTSISIPLYSMHNTTNVYAPTLNNLEQIRTSFQDVKKVGGNPILCDQSINQIDAMHTTVQAHCNKQSATNKDHLKIILQCKQLLQTLENTHNHIQQLAIDPEVDEPELVELHTNRMKRKWFRENPVDADLLHPVASKKYRTTSVCPSQKSHVHIARAPSV